MKINKLFVSVTALGLMVMGGALTGASAQEPGFTPTMTFELSDTKVSANPEMKVHVEQEAADEEEMSHTHAHDPQGLQPAGRRGNRRRFAARHWRDRDPGGFQLSSRSRGCDPCCGRCHASGYAAEIDRTDEQADRGVYAIWNARHQRRRGHLPRGDWFGEDGLEARRRYPCQRQHLSATRLRHDGQRSVRATA